MAISPTTGVDDRYSDDGGSVINTHVDQMVNWLLNWGRANSVWYLLFGLACCAIELMQTGGPRADLERFGSAPRPSPRSSDLIIVAGTLTYKMALRVKRLFDQMSEPRYVMRDLEFHGQRLRRGDYIVAWLGGRQRRPGSLPRPGEAGPRAQPQSARQLRFGHALLPGRPTGPGRSPGRLRATLQPLSEAGSRRGRFRTEV